MICELGDRVWVSSILLLIYWILKWQPVVELKIKSYWLQRTVDLLILSRVCSGPLSINSAFCCWFVDFWNSYSWQHMMICLFVNLLSCWYVELLSCWAVELLNCWTVELLSCWAVDMLSCWAVELLSCWVVDFWNGTM